MPSVKAISASMAWTLDFIDAVMVLESPYWLDVGRVRSGEARTQSFAYVFDVLSVLTVVYVARAETLRIISFRPTSEEDKEYMP